MSETARLLNPRMSHLPNWQGRSCAIVGHDGIDLCVGTNLVLFYTYLGFNVFFSKEPVSADLLVLKRYPGSETTQFTQQLRNCVKHNTPIHIYSYVGISPSAIIKELNGYDITHLAPSKELLTNLPGIHEYIAQTPVFPEYWARTPAAIEYEIAHIGNLKSGGDITKSWKEEQDLIQTLKDPRAHVWGKLDGWHKVKGINNLHGELKIALVPRTYARIKYALGLMYQFQQTMRTYSSRFWQAPLCGCPLIVEKQTSQIFPGIYPLGVDNINQKVHQIYQSREEIYSAAVQYWLCERTKTEKILVKHLDRASPDSKNNIISNLVWVNDPIPAIASGGIGPEFGFRGLIRE